MKKLLGMVFNRWVLGVLAYAALALLIWWGGPLLGFGQAHPLESERSRWIVIGLVGLLMIGWVVLRLVRARRGNQAVVDQLLAQPAPQAGAPAESADLQAVRQRFESALQTLRQTRFQGPATPGARQPAWLARLGGRYLYELPWYLIIGAPGSGKTTALCNAGLRFPLAAQGSAVQAVSGVGGTRHCDWWFTDQAVLIDTAGRFTTQDSDRERDRATWAGFMTLLKKSRPRQPLNGVLVTVSVTDLLTRSATGRAAHAATVRQRMQELHEQLGMRFPVYLLVTKVDLLAGFTEYFASLDKEQRAEPWGFTFDLDPTAQQSDTSHFKARYDELVQRLDAGQVELLQSERDVGRRARIYGFPAQLAGLREPLQEFMDAVFAPSSFEASPLLRGVYLISGTQEGTPIDRMLGTVARQFRLERSILPPLQASGRSYFLNRLLSDVVFAESGLAGIDLRWERRRQALVIGGYALIGLCSAGLATVSWLSYAHNRDDVAQVAERVKALEQTLRTTSVESDADVLALLPLLDETRQVASLERPDRIVGWGLYQGDKLEAGARLGYERLLVDALWPRVLRHVTQQLRDGSGGSSGAGSSDEHLYAALRAYLMLHDPEHYDADVLRRYLRQQWAGPLASRADPELGQRLNTHLDELLALRPVVPQARDEALVGQARTRLASISLPQRVYNHMRSQGLGDDFPEFTVARSGGPSAALVFTRTSGTPLTRGVAGLYTYEGYHRSFKRQIGDSARTLAQEQAWVLGGTAASPEGSQTLVDDVRRLYLRDYAATWEAFIADVKLQPVTSVQRAIEMTQVLSQPNGPLVQLLKEMSRHTTLSATDKSLVQQAEGKAKSLIDKGRDVVADLGGRPPVDPVATTSLEQQMVDDRFQLLRQYVTAPEGGKPPVNDTAGLLAEAQMFLTGVKAAIDAKQPMPPSDVPLRLKTQAPSLPPPVRAMVETLSDSSARGATLGIRGNLSQEVRANIGELCVQATQGRYPFDRRSSRDVTPADFAMLFGPGGKFDRFVQERLLPYVDTAARPWRFLPRDGAPLGADVGTLPQFQRATAIRDAFFASGATPVLRVEFKPVEMDSRISQLVIDIDGQVVRYSHGPQIPTQVQWPGSGGRNQIRMQVTPAGSSIAGQLVEGPWALLRLFDGRQIEPGNTPERFKVSFDFDGRKAVFEITASSVRNPLVLRELREFSCPNGL